MDATQSMQTLNYISKLILRSLSLEISQLEHLFHGESEENRGENLSRIEEPIQNWLAHGKTTRWKLFFQLIQTKLDLFFL